MRKLTHYMTPGLMAAALLFAPALVSEVAAQDAAATPAAQTPEDKECTDLYNKFYDLWVTKKDQPNGFVAGKAYLEKCGQRTDEQTTYVKGRVTKFEQAKLKFDYDEAVRKRTPAAAADVYKYGKQLLAAKPDDLGVKVALAFYGFLALRAKDMTYKADAISYAKQAIPLLESGAESTWDAYKDKGQALAWLNYEIGSSLIVDKNDSEAQAYLFKASQLGADIPKVHTLFFLAEAYNNNQVLPAIKAYEPFVGKPVTPEGEAASNHMNQVIARAMDYYARTVTAAGADPTYKQFKDDATEQLKAYYKSQHDNKEDGLTEFIAKVNSSPMPDPKSPLPAVAPTPPVTSTTTTGAASAPAPGATTSGAKPPLGSGPATPNGKTVTPAATPAPAPKPVSAKPPTKSKRHH